MKVVAINGSPHKEGNTWHILKTVAERLETHGIETQILQIGHKSIRGCTACGQCGEKKNERCSVDDAVNECIQLMKAADGIVLGSPVYYSGIAGTMKCFLDRAFYVAGANDGLFRHKVGTAVAVLRRSGGVTTFDQLNHYFTISEMPVASSCYWNAVHGRVAGEVLLDEEGVQTAKVLADNMAWMLKAMGDAKEPPPEKAKKIRTNFIR